VAVTVATYYYTYSLSVARELFLDRGARPRAPKLGTRNKGLRWNWSAFFVPKRSVLQRKKKVFARVGASSCPEKMRSPKKKCRIRCVFLS